MELKPELRSIHRKQSWNVVFTQSHYVVLMAWCSPQSLCSPWSTGPPISIPYISGCQTVGLLVRVSIPAQNMMTKRQVVEERFYSAYTSTFLFITKGSQDWNSSRSGSWIWCRGHGGMFLTGFLFPGLLSLLSYRAQDYQSRDGLTHKGPSSLDH